MGAGVYNSCGAGALRGNLRRGNASNARGGFVAQHPSRQNRLSLLAICVALACAVPARRPPGGDLPPDCVPQKHQQPNHSSMSGHYVLGAVNEKDGDLDAERKAFGWFVEDPQQFLERWKKKPNDPLFDNAEDLTTIGRAIDRWASLTEAYRDQV